MYACKVTCRTTVFIKYDEDTPTLQSTKAFFKQQLKKRYRLVSVRKIYDHKHWKNDFGEVAATIEVDVLVKHDPYVEYTSDYELRACRIVREHFFTGGTATQALYSKLYQPLRTRTFN
ncbi:hypothetical protein [Alkalicoccobacillus porphyridii]|uniref:Uncharacterized protein n=1 Tax=Alkalicoccobacillus porphyridii TaxID=2597270 RepID=A0A554A0T5_9BACI|nr:hypothetical protein [Alkalicoccobacillus porphyridii]TSB47307.1 hypothetical protein FN960_06085 [Alkalicoccobacillus porphyridii]